MKHSLNKNPKYYSKTVVASFFNWNVQSISWSTAYFPLAHLFYSIFVLIGIINFLYLYFNTFLIIKKKILSSKTLKMADHWISTLVMRPFGDPGQEKDICRSLNVERAYSYTTGNYAQFQCVWDKSCPYRVRWDKRNGQVQELGQHGSHGIGRSSDWTPSSVKSPPISQEILEQTRRRATLGVYPAARAITGMRTFWNQGVTRNSSLSLLRGGSYHNY